MAMDIQGTTLTAQGISKNFGSKSVLKGVDLEITPGEFIAVVGKSGSGKSTLLRLFAGLDTPNEGAVRIGGAALKGINTIARVMFQDARLLPWKRVLDNVGLGVSGDWKPLARETLAHVGLEDREREWPTVLSGGEKQRVALARALIHRPPLLLLDEPLGALDALTRIEMQQLLENIWQENGFTALLITHDVDEAVALADRVILIENGTIALDVAINLPRPRHRGSAQFAALKGRILNRVLGLQETEKEVIETVFAAPWTQKIAVGE